jgi:vacuolar-type H+-ATPase subunit I/STV1
MFGDIGHGIVMMLSAASLIALENKFKKGTGNEASTWRFPVIKFAFSRLRPS